MDFHRWSTRVVSLLTGFVMGAAVMVPASTAATSFTAARPGLLLHVSQAVASHYYAAHPEQAPTQLNSRAAASAGQRNGEPGDSRARCRNASDGNRNGPSAGGHVFNCDTTGLPQDEESISACLSNTNVVLGGTNDYRGIIDPAFNTTGWHFSLDGGNSVTNEGLLPPVTLRSDPTHQVPSGGDPVDFSDSACHLFAASLAFDPFDPFGQPNGVGVYRTEPSTLASCPGGSDPSCWPVRKLVVESTAGHFIDKEWMYVGVSGGTEWVWITYTDFANDPKSLLGFTGAKIMAVRCDTQLVSCTGPIEISTNDQDVQFSDITIGMDQRVYVTWSRIDGELEGTPQTFTHKLRIAAPGSLVFGPERIVHAEDKPIPFGGFLHANDFRVATGQKSDVAVVDGHARIFVVWDACLVRPGDQRVCEEPLIKLKYSDNDGITWSPVIVLSKGGDNYFPTISVDRARQLVAVAWYTNRYDPEFHSRQDVDLTSFRASNISGEREPTRLTASNDTQADPTLGGVFIGDYFEAFAYNGQVWVHYNANHRHLKILDQGVPVPQQDNYLIRLSTQGS
jgi:hypothetical protein